MIRFIRDIIGSQVLLFQEKAHVGPAREVIVSPDDGSFLGIVVFDPINRKNMVVPAVEIKGSGKDFLLICDYDSLTEPDDVVKIKAALEINPKIVGAKVETMSGQYLGKVSDATIDFKLMCLERLYVAPASFIQFLAKDLIIPAKKIIRIEKEKIIVSDEFVTESAKKPAIAAIPVPE
jgi:sporulation protein YlmC with PRC-barrel domain